MIPLGNWQERIDELESENFDLLEENRRLDDEVTDLLYEIDMLKDKLSEAQGERDKLKKLLAREVNRAETAEVLNEDYRAANDAWRESFEITIEAYDEVQARANSWFEVAKDLVRARDFWVGIAQEQFDKAAKAENTVDELKAALRVLGS